MRAFLSLLYWSLLALSCVPLFLGALLIWLVTRPFDPRLRALHLYTCLWAELYFRINPTWRLSIEGRGRLPARGAAVLVSNHESLGDILVLFGLRAPFKWVSKASVFKVPFIGWNMRLNGYVPLVRGNPESIAKMMADCDAWLERGVPVLLFPEGTRSKDGEVKAFKDGAFRLAIRHGCPVVPIALSGTSDVLPKHGFVLRRPADCRVQVLEPVTPAGHDVASLRELVRARIIEAKRMLEASAAPALAPSRSGA